MPRSQEGPRPADEAPGSQDRSVPIGARPAAKVTSRPLAPWKVVLCNDDVNDQEYVVDTLLALTPLNHQEVIQRTAEANRTGLSLLLTTHRERAELYERQLGKRNLMVTIEPAEQ